MSVILLDRKEKPYSSSLRDRLDKADERDSEHYNLDSRSSEILTILNSHKSRTLIKDHKLIRAVMLKQIASAFSLDLKVKKQRKALYALLDELMQDLVVGAKDTKQFLYKIYLRSSNIVDNHKIKQERAELQREAINNLSRRETTRIYNPDN